MSPRDKVTLLETLNLSVPFSSEINLAAS
jgi:hypothetical protein